MNLVDRSNGFWGELIKDRKNPRLLLTQRFGPNLQLMNILADEAISSIRGSVKHSVAIIIKNGKPTPHAFPVGRYPFGMLSNTTSTGIPLKPLKDATIRKREYEGNTRGKEFILRATSQHIYNGLKKLKVTEESFLVGWEGEDEEIVMKHEHGFVADTPMFEDKQQGIGAIVPPRNIRGLQIAFRENCAEILRRLVNPSY
jgi:hypothetical protein